MNIFTIIVNAPQEVTKCAYKLPSAGPIRNIYIRNKKYLEIFTQQINWLCKSIKQWPKVCGQKSTNLILCPSNLFGLIFNGFWVCCYNYGRIQQQRFWHRLWCWTGSWSIRASRECCSTCLNPFLVTSSASSGAMYIIESHTHFILLQNWSSY